jgi:hypothetical protein
MALTRLGLNQSINLATNTTGTLAVGNGGTGLTSGTTDQFLKFTGSTTLAPAEAGGGKLLQTQTALFTSSSAHNSETYTASNYTDQITPSATNSKIFVTFNLRSHIYQASGSSVRSQLAIYRQINGGGFSEFYPANAGISWGIGVSSGERTFYNTPQITFMDTTHNTTNAIDYTLYARRNTSSTGSVNVGGSSVQAQVILMEIGA